MAGEVTLLKSVVLKGFTVSLRSDNIIQITFSPNVIVKLNDAIDMVSAFAEVGGGKKYPLLFLAASDTNVKTEARYYAAGAEANTYTLASAFVVKSLAQKLLGNAYLSINKPITPTKLMNDEAEAVAWLKTFLKTA